MNYHAKYSPSSAPTQWPVMNTEERVFQRQSDAGVMNSCRCEKWIMVKKSATQTHNWQFQLSWNILSFQWIIEGVLWTFDDWTFSNYWTSFYISILLSLFLIMEVKAFKKSQVIKWSISCFLVSSQHQCKTFLTIWTRFHDIFVLWSINQFGINLLLKSVFSCSLQSLILTKTETSDSFVDSEKERKYWLEDGNQGIGFSSANC